MKKIYDTKAFRKSSVAAVLLLMPAISRANMNGASFSGKEIVLGLSLIILFIANYPVSMILSYRAKKRNNILLAVLSALFGSIYVIVWLATCYQRATESGEFYNLFVWLLFALIPLFVTWSACVSVIKNQLKKVNENGI